MRRSFTEIIEEHGLSFASAHKRLPSIGEIDREKIERNWIYGNENPELYEKIQTKDGFEDLIRDYSKGLWNRLYIYSHGGEVFSLSPFSCPWDSGMAGILYLDPDEFKKEMKWKNWSKRRKKVAEEVLQLRCEGVISELNSDEEDEYED